MSRFAMKLREHWLIVQRRKLVIVLCAVLGAGLGAVFALRQAAVYEATATVKFERSAALSALLADVLSYSSADSIETQVSLITSYPILEEVARRQGRLVSPPAGERPGESAAHTAALDSIARQLRVTRIPHTSLIDITATSRNPGEARDLANATTQAHRDYNRGVHNARLTEARKLIEAQLREVEARVRRAEEEVWAFREANRIIAPGAQTSVLLSVFTQLRGDIEKTRQQRTELELARDRLSRVDSASLGERVFVDSANPALQKLQSAEIELVRERNNLALQAPEGQLELQVVENRMRELRSEMRREIGAQVALLRSREDILNRQMGELLQRNRELPALELGLQRRQRDARTNDDLLTLLKRKHQEALIEESAGVEEVTIIRPASEPSAAVRRGLREAVLLGASLGLLVGLGLAFVQETLDSSVGTVDDVERTLQAPVLGMIPHIDVEEMIERLVARRPDLAQIDGDALRSHALLLTHFDPTSAVAGAYRTLRTNILPFRGERTGTLLGVTSSTPKAGTTLTTVNLALALAQNGQRTLLVGANMQEPSIHRVFGIEREPGLSDILVGRVRWRDCLRTAADILMGRFEMEDMMVSAGLEHLHIIEAGPGFANSSALLSSPAMSQFLREVRAQYDVVLIDMPAVVSVSDAAVMAAQMDGMVLVHRVGHVRRPVLKRVKAHLDSVRANVWGVVLNDVPLDGDDRAQAQPVRPNRPRKVRLVLVGIGVTVGLIAGLFAFMTWRFGPIGERLRGNVRQPPPVPSGQPAQPGDPQAALPDASESGGPATPAPSPLPPTADPESGSVTPPTDSPAGARTPGEVAPAGSSAPRPRPGATPSIPVTRFAVEFGPFVTAPEADVLERRLNEAGYQTVRFRQRVSADVFAVLIDLPDLRQAERVAAALREQGFPDPVVLDRQPRPAVRVGDPMILRGAVQFGEQLRARGYNVKIAMQPGEAVTFIVRHGNFTARHEAEAKSQELERLGLANHVVRVR